MYIPADKTAQLQMIYMCQNEICENVYNFLGTAEWDVTSLTALGTAMQGWENVHGKVMRHTSTQLQKMIATDLSSQTGPEVVSVLGAPIIGTDTGGLTPNNVTIAVSERTTLRGRSFRGRVFHIGLAAGRINGNFIFAADQAAFVTHYSAIFTTVSGVNGALLAVVSRRHNNAPRTNAVVTAVNNFSINQALDSQRRRLPEHNRHR